MASKPTKSGRWISVRTRSGRFVHVFIPRKGTAYDGHSLVKGAKRPMPDDLHETVDARRRPFHREDIGGHSAEASRNPLHRMLPEERKYEVRLTAPDGTVSDLQTTNKRANVGKILAGMRKASAMKAKPPSKTDAPAPKGGETYKRPENPTTGKIYYWITVRRKVDGKVVHVPIRTPPKGKGGRRLAAKYNARQRAQSEGGTGGGRQREAAKLRSVRESASALRGDPGMRGAAGSTATPKAAGRGTAERRDTAAALRMEYREAANKLKRTGPKGTTNLGVERNSNINRRVVEASRTDRVKTGNAALDRLPAGSTAKIRERAAASVERQRAGARYNAMDAQRSASRPAPAPSKSPAPERARRVLGKIRDRAAGVKMDHAAIESRTKRVMSKLPASEQVAIGKERGGFPKSGKQATAQLVNDAQAARSAASRWRASMGESKPPAPSLREQAASDAGQAAQARARRYARLGKPDEGAYQTYERINRDAGHAKMAASSKMSLEDWRKGYAASLNKDVRKPVHEALANAKKYDRLDIRNKQRAYRRASKTSTASKLSKAREHILDNPPKW
jgi:hypothetical protein